MILGLKNILRHSPSTPATEEMAEFFPELFRLANLQLLASASVHDLIIFSAMEDCVRKGGPTPPHQILPSSDEPTGVTKRDNDLADFLEKAAHDAQWSEPGLKGQCHLWFCGDRVFINHYQDYWVFDYSLNQFL